VTSADQRPQPASRRGFLELLLLVARRDYLRTVRRRGFILGTALLPLSIVLFMLLSALSAGGFGPGGPSTDPTIRLVDETLLDLQADPTTAPHVVFTDRDEALAQLRSGAAQEVYVLPAGYLETGRIERIVPPRLGFEPAALQRRVAQEQELAAYLRGQLASRAGLSREEIERLIAPFQVRDVTLDGAPSPVPSPATFLVPYVFATLFVISIFITSGYLLQSVTEEKENRVIEILLSSIPPLPLMAGKIIGLGAAGLTQVLIWLATAFIGMPLIGERVPGLADLDLAPGPLLLAIVYFVLGYLAYGAIFSAIGALAPGAREAQQYSGFFGFFAVIPLVMTGAFLADPGGPIVTALVLIPMTAPAAAPQLLVLGSDPSWPLIAISLALLVGFVIVATIGSARIFRATLLLYGTRPSLGGIARALLARA
jgi:ABC-2 type transport system permease protein